MFSIKRHILILILAGLTVTGARADDAKSDLKSLEGTWDVISIEADGMRMEAGGGAPEKLVVKRGVATFFADNKEIPAFRALKLRVDETKKPRAVDLIRGANQSLPCIYELKDDTLKLAVPMVPASRKPGEMLKRPTSFETRNKPIMLLTIKRNNG